MKVRVKLLSPAGDMPKGFDPFGEAEMDLATGTTVANVMSKIDLPKEESYTSLVDGQPILPDDRASHALRDGDEITLLPAIQGG
jgi:sulfur carrier protein ThiS